MLSGSRPSTLLHVGHSFSYLGYWVNNYGAIELEKEIIMVTFKIILHYFFLFWSFSAFSFLFFFILNDNPVDKKVAQGT